MNNKNSTGCVISDASYEDLREVSAAIDGMCRYSPDHLVFMIKETLKTVSEASYAV